jgi:proteasome lid subunit RPN8/RPN11
MVVPLVNLSGPEMFFADPWMQYKAEKLIYSLQLDLVAIYHSHPAGTATLSQFDLMFARPDITQVVVATDGLARSGEVMRAYRCDGSVVEVPVLVTA